VTTAIYDGYCVLCQQTRRIVKALDWLHRVEFLDLNEWETVKARYPSLEWDEVQGQIHVVEPDGKILGGFWGMRRLLRDLPLGIPLWLLLHLPGMKRLGPRIYGYIARHRYAINRFFGVELPQCEKGACKIPQ
jgi:predicted DCC family thiol-disulfide oxidoreductase YuxK